MLRNCLTCSGGSWKQAKTIGMISVDEILQVNENDALSMPYTELMNVKRNSLAEQDWEKTSGSTLNHMFT